jgi:formamidopyrimidine-DNA glycosylase
MPELPEAESIARELHRRLARKTVERVDVLRPDVVHGQGAGLIHRLPGRRVVAVRRRAKRVVIDLSPPARLVVRLGMTGRLTLHPRTEPVEKHTHLRIAFANFGRELRFRDVRRFGGVWCFLDRVPPEHETVGDVGLEPLEATLADFARVLDRKRQIKALLLDQTAIAGLGNIYADESLHAARIHPLRRADTLTIDQQRRLYQAIRRTLQRAIRFNGSTLMDYRNADGAEGSFQRLHRVYQREGRPCRRCGTAIRRILAAGRSSFLCPKCQGRKTPKR